MSVLGSIILFLLKLIGILLLAVLGILFLLLLLVLFVPVRYRGQFVQEAEGGGRTLRVRISWLNPLLRLKLWLEENKLHYTVRVLGLCLKNSDKPGKPKKTKAKGKRTQEKNAEPATEQVEQKETLTQEETKAQPGELLAQGETEAPREEPERKDASELVLQQEPSEEAEAAERQASSEETRETQNGSGQKKSMFGRISAKIQGVGRRIRTLLSKLRAIPVKLWKKLQRIKAEVLLLVKKKNAVLDFISDEKNRETVGEAFGVLGRMLRHILPYRLKGTLIFGTGDPESTGKAFGAAAFFYPVYAKSLKLQPDFSEKRLEADLTFRGRIRLATLLWRFARFWWSKKTKQFRKRFQRLRRVLKEKAE